MDFHPIVKATLMGVEDNVGAKTIMKILNNVKFGQEPEKDKSMHHARIELFRGRKELARLTLKIVYRKIGVLSSNLIGARVLVLIFDVCSKDSLNKVEGTVNLARRNSAVEMEILLIGNKNDLPNRVVSVEEAEQFAVKMGLFYLDTSAKLDSGTIIRAKLEEVVEKYLSTKKLEEPAPANNPVQPLIPQQLPAPIPVPPQQPVQENKGCTLI